MDTYGHFGPELDKNLGWEQRREAFIESKEGDTDKWKTDSVPFWGVLSTDFDTCRRGNALQI
jgi:hypothetical protein